MTPISVNAPQSNGRRWTFHEHSQPSDWRNAENVGHSQSEDFHECPHLKYEMSKARGRKVSLGFVFVIFL